ncbi:MAG TPA: hypothetical protein VFF24_13415, partial [Acidimicrobiia bacterium]|nr:hypothetical protein [Acidimicrobiia bacterium]
EKLSRVKFGVVRDSPNLLAAPIHHDHAARSFVSSRRPDWSPRTVRRARQPGNCPPVPTLVFV